MTNGILRVGVLGQGRSGHGIHVKWLREVPGQYKIVAVSDEMPERLKQAEEELGVRTYARYQDLLSDSELELDLVVNALPSFLHPKGTVEALEAGHHVVCEKPLAKTVTDFDGMVEAAGRTGKLLLPFQNSRFYLFFRKMREIIASGKLGKIVYIQVNSSNFSRRWDWQTIQEFWGGNLLNTGPHSMDQAVVLFGEESPEVFSRLASENPYGDADNFALVVLYGKNAPTIEVVVSSFQAYRLGEQYNVSGTCGGLEGGPKGLKWRWFEPEKAPDHNFEGEWSDRRYCREKVEWVEESWTPPESEIGIWEQNSKAFYDNVYEVIVNGAKPVVTVAQVRRQVAVMEECHRQNPLPRMERKFGKGRR